VVLKSTVERTQLTAYHMAECEVSKWHSKPAWQGSACRTDIGAHQAKCSNQSRVKDLNKAQNCRKAQLRGAKCITIFYFVCPLSSSRPRQDSDQALLQWLSACQDATATQMLCQQGQSNQQPIRRRGLQYMIQQMRNWKDHQT